ECSDDKIIRFDLKIGVDTPYPGKDVFGSMRLVSKPGEAAATVGTEPVAKPAAEREKPATQESAPAATAAPAVSSKPAGSVPRPVKRALSDEDKAVFKARAKAWAAEKKK
ncbi:MAG TPA: hypothetical protein QGF86_09265, partial [Nitrospinaceae bacterium]|nr:hypothetical protein [Nitrospinaceae bacterium]